MEFLVDKLPLYLIRRPLIMTQTANNCPLRFIRTIKVKSKAIVMI